MSNILLRDVLVLLGDTSYLLLSRCLSVYCVVTVATTLSNGGGWKGTDQVKGIIDVAMSTILSTLQHLIRQCISKNNISSKLSESLLILFNLQTVTVQRLCTQ